jgi:hypothetical protein
MHFLANHFNVGFGNFDLLQAVSVLVRSNNEPFEMDLSHRVNSMVFGSSESHSSEVKK